MERIQHAGVEARPCTRFDFGLKPPRGPEATLAILLEHQVEAPRPCSYLPEREAQLEHLIMQQVRPEELDALLSRGWRRFGPDYFRPACEACGECVSIRVPTATFRPTRSQRKAANRCRRFRREVGAPTADAARLALYAKWHASREDAREWNPSDITLREYRLTFCGPEQSGREVTWWDDADPSAPRLVAVGYFDETPTATSAIYFFFDPDLGQLSPGSANVVFAVEDAAARGLEHVYLGYRVLGCASLRYKAGFGPHELLHERPGFRERPEWVAGSEPDAPPGPRAPPGDVASDG